jgi:HPt (histidine-containing phosphotransfer) domain-containing protein
LFPLLFYDPDRHGVGSAETGEMAFKSMTAAAIQPAEEPPASHFPVDLNHLYRQTMGDRYLQREVLKLFLRYSTEQIDRLRRAESVAERREAAHSLVGSARGIGAFSIATIAGEIEAARGPVVGRMKALEAAAAAARTFIRDFLAE